MDGSWNARLAKHPFLRKTLSWFRILPGEKAKVPWSRDIFIHDVRKPLPFASFSADAIYASHILEHLYREQGEQLIRESFRVLVPGGIIRIVVPDLHAIVHEYLGNRFFGELSFRKKTSLRETGSISDCSCVGHRPQDAISCYESMKPGRISTPTNGCTTSNLSPACSALLVLLTLRAETTPRARSQI